MVKLNNFIYSQAGHNLTFRKLGIFSSCVVMDCEKNLCVAPLDTRGERGEG